MHVVQGRTDPFGTPDELLEALPDGATLDVVTGAHSIGDAARMIKDDDADIMLAGGAEATICPIGIAGFAQARAL